MAKSTSEYLYTKGNEFSFNGQNYIGEYHYENMTPTTGPRLGSGAILRKIYTNTNNYAYDTVIDFNNLVYSFVSPKPYTLTINDQAYSTGYTMRYFVEKINNTESYPIEIDKEQYKQYGKLGGIDNGLYKIAIVNWKLTGVLAAIRLHNEREIYKASGIISKIYYAIRNYTEYTRIN